MSLYCTVHATSETTIDYYALCLLVVLSTSHRSNEIMVAAAQNTMTDASTITPIQHFVVVIRRNGSTRTSSAVNRSTRPSGFTHRKSVAMPAEYSTVQFN